MQITLNKNSRHFKYYSWVLNTHDAPKSLCPYFWIMFFLLGFSPVILLIKGIEFLVDKLPKTKRPHKLLTEEEIKKKNKREDFILNGILFLGKALLVFVIGLLVCLLYMLGQKTGWVSFIKGLFMVIGFGFTLFLIVYFFVDNWNKILNLAIIKIPVQMIKALYTKTCPLINWK